MTITRHVYEIYIKASPEQIWQALTDPAFTVRYFHHTAVESEFRAGEPYRYVMADGSPAIEGEVEEADPPRRLAMTFRFLYDPELAAEPPSRVEWIVTPAGDVTRLTLRHGDLFKSPLTWDRTRLGWLTVVHGLKTLLETGEELGKIDDPEAADHTEDPEGEWHRAQGITAFNATWGCIEDNDLEEATLSAYTSSYHWARAARRGPENDARGQWLISRIWSLRGNGPLALHHADLSMDACVEADLDDFDLAYAHEARGRAMACLGQLDAARGEREIAASTPIAGDEDRSIFESDLSSEPWFGA